MPNPVKIEPLFAGADIRENLNDAIRGVCMELGPDLGPSPDEPVRQDFTVSAFGLTSRTLSLWIRQLFAYMIIVGVTQFLFQLVQSVLMWVLFGTNAEYLSTYLSTDPLTFAINIILITLDPYIPVSAAVLSLFMLVAFALMIVAVVVYAVVVGGAIKHALDDYGPRNATIGTSISHATSRAVPLIITQVIVGLITAAMMAPAIITIIVAFNIGSLDLLFSSLGLLVIGIIAMIYVYLRLSVAVVVIVAEDLSVMDSIKKSWALTQHNFMHIFGGYIVLFIVQIFLILIAGIIIAPILVYSGIIGGLFGVLFSAIVSGFVATLILGPIPYVYLAVLYKDLQSRSATGTQDWW